MKIILEKIISEENISESVKAILWGSIFVLLTYLFVIIFLLCIKNISNLLSQQISSINDSINTVLIIIDAILCIDFLELTHPA